MAINLQKGQSISLKKQDPKLEAVICGLGWDVAKNRGGLGSLLFGTSDFDLDGSVLCLNKSGKLTTKQNVIFFGNLRHNSGAIKHLGDNLTGEGKGDDEQILVDLNQLPSNINKLIFVVNIYQALQRKQDFSKVENAFVRLVNLTNQKEIARYSLSGNGYEGKTAMIMAEISRQNDDWKMTAIGKGLNLPSLEHIIKSYL
jgi:stress response protein SCP2